MLKNVKKILIKFYKIFDERSQKFRKKVVKFTFIELKMNFEHK